MNKNYLNLFAVLIAFVTGTALTAQNITSFSPTSGAVGSSVVITGTGFSTTASANIVYFDNSKATVTGATATSLTVTVPYGSSTYSTINVIKGGIQRSSANMTTGTRYFNVTFSGGSMTPSNYEVQSVPTIAPVPAVTAGDMNGDGITDIVAVTDGSSTNDSVKVYISNGTFGYTMVSKAWLNIINGAAVSLADIDNDGDLDVLVSIYNSASDIKFFTNNGSGVLTAGNVVSAGYCYSVVPGDLNGDGWVDFVVSSGNWYINKLINNQNGTFTQSQISATGAEAVAVADFNNDGKLDVFASRFGSTQYEVFTGSGTGGFTSQGLVTAACPIGKAIPGDFNKDGKIDIAYTSYTNNMLAVAMGNGNATFGTAVTTTASNARDVRTGDFDGDGNVDLESQIYSAGTPGFYLYKGSATGTFNAPITVPNSNTVAGHCSGAVGDFNHDGKPDLVTANNNGGGNTMQIQYYVATPLAVTITASTSVTCNGGSNGSATTSTVGGFAPYTYSWTGGSTAANPTNLTAGTKTVTVTDAVGATATATVTIAQATAIATSVTSQTNVNCFGGSTGAATISASGGTPSYTYSWAPSGGTSTSITGVTASVYTCSVTDAAGCVKTQTVNITQPSAPLGASISSQTNVTCNSLTNGSATIAAAGGTPAYAYNWTPSGGTTATAVNRPAGNYTCTVTDSKGCTYAQPVTITQPTALSGSIVSQTNITCNGGSNGAATIGASGATPAYTYSWTPSGGTAASASSLTAGTYTCTIKDANNCSLAIPVSITQPTAINSSISSSTNVSCFGGNNGSATVAASGGTGTLTYSWAPSGGTGVTASSLIAGTYTCTITDGNSCTKTQTVTITQPAAPLSGTITAQTNIGCFGGSTGAATLTVSGGTTPYTYTWSPSGGTAATISGRTAGTYTCNVTDTKGCTATQTVSLTQPAILNSSATQVNVSCLGGSDGSATVTPTGGTTPYTYTWTPGTGTAATKTGLNAGTHTCTVTDANGCTKIQTVTITQPGGLGIGETVHTDVSCNGGSNGASTLSVNGGTPPYTYTWTPSGGNTNAITGRTAGNYTCNITDANGCTSNIFTIITQPAALGSSISAQTNISCNGGNNGAATVSVTGGTAPYSYNWAPSGGTAASISGRTAGTYTCTITDNNGCTRTQTVTLTEPAALGSSISAQTNITCHGASTGAATVSVTGGATPYSYSWAPSGGTAASISGRTAGTYTCTITDNNSCTRTQTVTLTEPTAVTITFSTANSTCGGSNGSATAIPSGGAGGYTYLWNAAAANQTTATANNLAAGSYVVTVTDATGCTGNNTANVSNTGGPSVAMSGANISCFGACTGTATASASGGSPPYTYSWAPSGGTAATASSLCAGTYSVTVTDNAGCSIVNTRTVTQPTQATSTFTKTNVSCNGGSNGSATISVSGGTPPYTYSWAPSGGTGTTANSLAAGTYTCTVTDANACVTNTHTVTITQPTALTATNTGTNVSCNGTSTGSATAIPAGGTSPYTYSWAPSGGIGATASSLAAGNYTCTVTDANSCVTTTSLTITQPSALAATTTQNNVSCNGMNNGSAGVTASGGTAPYTYSWSPAGGTSATATNLSPASYTCVITDNHGCAINRSFTITQPAALGATISSQTNVSCNGGNNGAATVSVSGGTPSYTYSWAPSGGTGTTASGLSSGTYTCTVTDANACVTTVTVNITQPALLTVSGTHTNVSCNGGANASATVVVSGGTPLYTYIWAPSGGNTATANALAAGSYTCTVSDSHGCTAFTSVTISQPTVLSASSTQTNVSCNGGNNGSATATATASGGTSPYSYNWTPTGGTAATANGLTAGTYTCTITDANSCATNTSVTVTQPAAISVSSTQSNVSCNGGNDGSATLSVSGGTPTYTYSWAPSGGTAATAIGLSAGNYTCTISDISSCPATYTLTIYEPSLITSSIFGTNVLCNGGSSGAAGISVNGGTPPYTYNWTPTGGTGSTANGLSAGTYTCQATDANGCVSSNTITVTEPAALSVNPVPTAANCNAGSDGTATINVSGGTPAYSYSWTSGGSAATETGLSAGNYTCTVSDANGCTIPAVVTISEPAPISSSFTTIDVTCNGGNNGSATIAASGGTAGYTFSWSSGGTGSGEGGLIAGTYTCTITDAHSCVSSNTVTITEPVAINTSISGTNVTCPGGTDGSATITASGGTGVLTYNWIPAGGTSATASGLASGSYTCVVTDANGCPENAVYTITEPAPFNAAITQLTNAGCTGGTNGSAQIVVTGGTTPYTYSWSSGGTADTETGLAANTYTCSYTDNHSCTGSATVAITANGNTDIYGDLTFTGGTISSGWAYAFVQQSSLNGIDTVAIVPVSAGPSSNYLFSALPPANYLIKVILDTTLHPTAVPTYYGNVFEWDSSLVVSHGCLQTDTADIDVIETIGGSGTGFISGYIIEGPGYQGLRLANNGGQPNLPFIPGGPLKGIDVKLGKNPNSGIQARMSTDSTGYYHFNNLPYGDFNIYVDIPNLPMDSLRHVVLSSGADTSIQNNYFADSIFIYIDTIQFVGIHASVKVYDNQFSIYPNPTTNVLNLQFNLAEASQDVSMEITSAMGAVVYRTDKQSFGKGANTLTLSARKLQLEAGVYFVNMISGNKRYTQRIVVIE